MFAVRIPFTFSLSLADVVTVKRWSASSIGFFRFQERGCRATILRSLKIEDTFLMFMQCRWQERSIRVAGGFFFFFFVRNRYAISNRIRERGRRRGKRRAITHNSLTYQIRIRECLRENSVTTITSRDKMHCKTNVDEKNSGITNNIIII